MIVLGLECDIHVDGVQLEQVPGFKYLGCVLDELGADVTECQSMVNVWSL